MKPHPFIVCPCISPVTLERHVAETIVMKKVSEAVFCKTNFNTELCRECQGAGLLFDLGPPLKYLQLISYHQISRKKEKKNNGTPMGNSVGMF